MIDMTERDALEQALRQSEGNLRSVLDGIPAMIAYWDHNLCNKFGNRAYEEWFGWKPNEMRGHHIREIIGDKLYALNLPYMEGALRGEPQLFERTITIVSGQRRHTQASYIPDVRDGKVNGFFVLVTDITRRKEAEDALAASEAQLQALISMAGVGIVVIDIDAKIRLFNKTAEQLFGWTAAEVIGCNINILAPDPVRNEHDEHIRRYRETGQSRMLGTRREVAALRRDGSVFPVELSVGRFEVPTGSMFVGIITDISERQRHIRAITEANSNLERQAAKMAALAEDLDRAREAAETANRAKSEFLSNMSHELRTPLNAILGFAQLLGISKVNPLDDIQREHVDFIVKGGELLLDLIDDILNLAKIEAGKLSLSIESTQLGEIVDECIALANPIAVKYDVSIEKEVDGTLPNICADRIRSRQAILNLLSNAAKYNRKGGTVRIFFERPEPDYLRLVIADTGHGIPAERQHQLFQPFNRLGAEQSEIEGSGIGLVLTKKLMEAMNGQIGFSSVENHGSQFWLDFRLETESPARDGGTERSERLKTNLKLDGQPRLVLYIEDNPANLHLMEAIVQDVPGLSLISAHNAELGIALAESRHPDIIILDINLPGMSGIDAIRYLKRNAGTSDIPCLALSADATARTIEQGLEAGFVDYLTKPVKIPDLLAAIHKALGEGW